MPIKLSTVLSREDFDAALRQLRISVSEVAKDTAIPRTYLSEFRGGERNLKPEFLGKLRDYFEGKGIQFEDDPPADPAPRNDPPAAPHPRLKTTSAPRCYFPIAEGIPDEFVTKAIEVMEENDARFLLVCKTKVALNDGLFGDDQFTDESKAAIQEAFALLAENYVIFRQLRGWHPLGLITSADEPQTVQDVVFNELKKQLASIELLDVNPVQPAADANEDDPVLDPEEQEASA